jgi:hypothetical protein
MTIHPDAAENSNMTVDPHRWADRIRAAANGERPDFQTMLATWAAFLDAKHQGDLEQMRSLLAPAAFIRSWGAERRVPPVDSVQGADAIVAHWGGLCAAGQPPPEELDVDRLLVSDDGIAMDGRYRTVLPAHAVPGLAPGTAGAVLIAVRAAVLVRFTSGLIAGYDIYWDIDYQVSDWPVAAGAVSQVPT